MLWIFLGLLFQMYSPQAPFVIHIFVPRFVMFAFLNPDVIRVKADDDLWRFNDNGIPNDDLWRFNDNGIPNVILRQTGSERMMVYLLKEGVSLSVSTVISGVLDSFKPECSLYMFDPFDEKFEPDFSVAMPILETVSPDDARYKQFSRKVAHTLYMPIWECDELLSAGAHIREGFRNDNPKKLLYSATKIKERYLKFGGIIRSVLPFNYKVLRRYVNEQKQAINGAIIEKLMKDGAFTEIINGEGYVSHFLLHHEVEHIDSREGEGRALTAIQKLNDFQEYDY